MTTHILVTQTLLKTFLKVSFGIFLECILFIIDLGMKKFLAVLKIKLFLKRWSLCHSFCLGVGGSS